MITSLQNEKVKLVRAIRTRARARRDSGVFLCEGVRLLEEGLASAWPARFVLYSEGLGERATSLINRYRQLGVPIEEVSSKVMQEITDTEQTQGVLAVMYMEALALPPERDFVVIPTQMRDPGNLGTILRTAAAAGVGAVLIPPGTTDAFAPKVLRAGMGAHFRIPIQVMTWDAIHDYLGKTPRLHVFLASAGGGCPYSAVDLRMPLAFIIGGEAFGADEAARSLVDETIHIEMPGKMESLNAASAAAILIFEALRQRKER
jgi:TrmH family RNA methyltransferase